MILNVDWATYNLQQFILMQTSQIICHVPFWIRGKHLNSDKNIQIHCFDFKIEQFHDNFTSNHNTGTHFEITFTLTQSDTK